MGLVLVRTQPLQHSEMENYTVTNIIIRLFLMACVVSAQDEGSGNGLPAGADSILSSSYNPDSFSCDKQAYGYYADIESGCEIFHICVPVESEEEGLTTLKYSFFCGNGTVFDQEYLVCNHRDDAFPCEESPSLFGAVPFGEVLEDY